MQNATKGDLWLAEKFVTTFLEEVYFESAKLAQFRRILNQIKKALCKILKTT